MFLSYLNTNLGISFNEFKIVLHSIKSSKINVKSKSMPSGVGGSHCTAGYYCPEASAFAVACEPGYYCANDRLNDTSGQCDAGYYCTSLQKCIIYVQVLKCKIYIRVLWYRGS
jgi:hypothetical protein